MKLFQIRIKYFRRHENRDNTKMEDLKIHIYIR